MRNYTFGGKRESAQLRVLEMATIIIIGWIARPLGNVPCNGPIRRPISSIDIGSKIPWYRRNVEYTRSRIESFIGETFARCSRISRGNRDSRSSESSLFPRFLRALVSDYYGRLSIERSDIFPWLAGLSLRNHGFAVPWPNMASFLRTAGWFDENHRWPGKTSSSTNGQRCVRSSLSRGETETRRKKGKEEGKETREEVAGPGRHWSLIVTETHKGATSAVPLGRDGLGSRWVHRRSSTTVQTTNVCRTANNSSAGSRFANNSPRSSSVSSVFCYFVRLSRKFPFPSPRATRLVTISLWLGCNFGQIAASAIAVSSLEISLRAAS